ncbi:hypothetical protein QO004_003009 [Rhizobium mesoamericanum]|uniref:DUF3088 domain-containing protein n=1 Tax=Rhizobium mesoamericanum TaxID=1079800 RepID=UPI00278127EC|nr:DUF3088 domain-containing protein [Rhizobium mesoamericanum]MDQ0561216.1 hypothetical protein [Rhizobium mesoamericanum]
MSRDTLFLIAPGFLDPKQPGRTFVCPHCNAIEGLLSSFPELARRLDVHRVPFPRPRARVIEAVGEENQSLPVLVLASNPPPDAADWKGKRFVAKTGRILDLLAERHGFPRLHD